jgi:predicted DsbA family dithiol-disulfide isomerase
MTQPVLLEVFADLWCPFAHLGLRAAKATYLELGRDDVVLWVRAWPLELVNGAPMDPDRAAANAAALRDQVVPDRFANVAAESFPGTTLPGLALAHAAYRVAPEVGEQMSFALRDALFEEGRDVSDPAVLAELAERFGVPEPDEKDREGVLEDYAEGQARGVIGSPHFFCGTSDHFCPSLEITQTEGGRRIQLQAAELTDFLTRCLGPSSQATWSGTSGALH